MFNESIDENTIKIDLHGKSLVKARREVVKTLRQAKEKQIKKIIFVTGRGNHPNSDGRRGVILKAFLDWLNTEEFRPLIKLVSKGVGSFTVHLNQPEKDLTVRLPEQKWPSSELKRKRDDDQVESKSVQELRGKKPKLPLIKIIRDTQLENKIEIVKVFLAKNPRSIYETCKDGTTPLMIAAANNEVELMELLIQQEPSLGLKRSREDGTNALTDAIVHGSIESIDFLLQRAPSLLKKKYKDDMSVFDLAKNARRSSEVFKILFKHLKPHRREKGYTDLFRIYKKLKQDLSINDDHNSQLVVVESKALKENKKTHGWFYMDRMTSFLKQLGEGNRYRSIKVKNKFSLNFQHLSLWRTRNESIFLKSEKIRKFTLPLLRRNKYFRKLFLKFNSAAKTYYQKRYKHAFDYTVARRMKFKPKGTEYRGVQTIVDVNTKFKSSSQYMVPVNVSSDQFSYAKPILFSTEANVTQNEGTELKEQKEVKAVLSTKFKSRKKKK